MVHQKFLPGTGRGTKTRSGLVEGARHSAAPSPVAGLSRAPSTTGYAGGPLPVPGRNFR
jgi:hypothetical protein